jgi:chlorophyll synthase
MGIDSLPAVLGVEGAARLACVMMAGPQAVVITLLAIWGHTYYAAGVAVLLLAQFALMGKLMAAPREKAPWYNGTGTTLYVIGMLVTAFALQAGVTP